MDEIRHYSKAGCAYSLPTDEADEATLQRLGYILMQSEYPGPPFVAAADGAWVIDSAQAFGLLRAERDRRIAATDYLFMQDYPLSDDQRPILQVYRQSLRDLPSQEGAPWDGGGEATPWPDLPAGLKA